jgi:hypothetical protein
MQRLGLDDKLFRFYLIKIRIMKCILSGCQIRIFLEKAYLLNLS